MAELKTGVIASTADLLLTEKFQEVPGTTLEITPTEESHLFVVANFSWSDAEGGQSDTVYGSIVLDSGEPNARQALGRGGPDGTSPSAGSATQCYVLTLSAAKHSVHLVAKKFEFGSSSALDLAHPHTGFSYILIPKVI